MWKIDENSLWIMFFSFFHTGSHSDEACRNVAEVNVNSTRSMFDSNNAECTAAPTLYSLWTRCCRCRYVACRENHFFIKDYDMHGQLFCFLQVFDFNCKKKKSISGLAGPQFY